MEFSEFCEWESSVQKRIDTTIQWIRLVLSFKHDAPTHLLQLYEDAFPTQKGVYDASTLKISVSCMWVGCFELLEEESRVRLFYTINKELYFGPHRSPYPVEDKSLWPWTSLEYECPKFDKHIWFKIILFTEDVRFWLTMSTVSKQFHKWIKTDCDTADFPLWYEFDRERRLCFGVEPLVKLKSWEFAVLASNLTKQSRTKLGLLLIACAQIPFADMHVLIHTKVEDVMIRVGSSEIGKKYISLNREKQKRNLTLKFSTISMTSQKEVNGQSLKYLSHTVCTDWKLGLQQNLVIFSLYDRPDQLQSFLPGGENSPNKRLKK